MRAGILSCLFAGMLASAADISQLAWLSGCWEYDGGEPGSGEFWSLPAGGSLLAVARTVKDGRTTGFEYLRIMETDDNSLALFASPSGQDTTRFELLRLTESEVVFENSGHDFPQRIGYLRGDGERLLGHIEGESEGEKVSVDFPMQRVSCGDQPS